MSLQTCMNLFLKQTEFFKTNGVCNVLLRFFFGKRYENDIWLKNTITENVYLLISWEMI